MTLTLVAARRDFAVLTDAWRIPRADVKALTGSAELLEAASQRAALVQADAAEAAEVARREGFHTGLQEGRAAGAAQAARALVALVAEVRRVQGEQGAKLGQLSLEVMRRIAAELGPQAVLEAVVERAVREVLADRPLAVHVAPEAAPGVGLRLQALGDQIEVVADREVAADQCVILTPQGSARSGLELQLAALERAFAEMAEAPA